LLIPEDWGAFTTRFFRVRVPIFPGANTWGNSFDITDDLLVVLSGPRFFPIPGAREISWEIPLITV
jgi:hypothetical protein